MPENNDATRQVATLELEERIDLGDELEVDSAPSIEEKYREQMRQILPQKIELPISTLQAMIKEQINLNPEFQRRDRWNTARQSRFIESIIMNVPIPPVFLGEDEYGMYVVLDGRQRLTAVNEFLKNTYALRGLEVWNVLNGKRFNDLKKQDQDKYLTRRFIPAVLILRESSPEVKYDVFDRLNTGAVTAEPMEIRNAVFQGQFNNLLRALSDNPTFRRLWGIPTESIQREKNPIYQKMLDLELVLRFFALRDYSKMNMRFKDYLSFYLSQRNDAYKQHDDARIEDERQFQWAVTNCWKVFGNDAFRRPATGIRSATLADAFMVSLSTVDPHIAASGDHPAELKSALSLLVTDDREFMKGSWDGHKWYRCNNDSH